MSMEAVCSTETLVSIYESICNYVQSADTAIYEIIV
jgi:hypothetical protein